MSLNSWGSGRLCAISNCPWGCALAGTSSHALSTGGQTSDALGSGGQTSHALAWTL